MTLTDLIPAARSADWPGTLTELLASLRDSTRRLVFPEQGDTELPHHEIPDRACALAVRLRAAGVGHGRIVGMLIPTGPQWVISFLAVPVTGAAVSPLPLPPVLTDAAAVAGHLAPMIEAGRIRHIVAAGVGFAVARELSALCPGLVVVDVTDVADALPPPGAVIQHVDAGSLAMVQYSSGSTSHPKGVMLTHHAVLAGLRAINTHLRAGQEDVLVQWVPLFHDMGVVALLCSLLTPNDAHLFSPMTFIRDPGCVLARIARVRGSIVSGPNFSFDKFIEVADRVFGSGEFGDAPLSSLRIALNGAEQVRATTVARFQRTFGALGAPLSSMSPGYGMAEATLAVTLPVPDTVPRTLAIDRDITVPGSPVVVVPSDHPRARVLTSVGVPVPGMSVRIVDSAGVPVPDNVFGEICIQGRSVTTGYLYDEERTAQTIRHGWLHTGDAGFRYGGELFVAGRLKEMIVVQGRNYFPEDVEEVVCGLPDIHKGHCVAFADTEAERIVVVVESRLSDEDAKDRLIRRIRGAVSGGLGLSSVHVLLVPPRTLPRTTSGKWQRSRVKDFVLEHSHA